MVPFSLVPHLIGPLLIGPPTHWSSIHYWNSLSHWPQSHWFTHLIDHPKGIRLMVPFSLVPHLIGPLLIGPPTHWSSIHYWNSLSHWPQSHWFPHLIDPLCICHPIIGPSQWSPISLAPHLISPPISTHAPSIPLVPHLIGPPSHWSPTTLFEPIGPPF